MVEDLIAELRPNHAALVCVLVRSDGRQINVDPGADPVDERSLFEIGSITKTVTGTLLADMVVGGELRLDTCVGDVLDDGGHVASVTLVELATHTAGLPRLAPNHDEVEYDPNDPYRHFDADALQAALTIVELTESREPAYSNFGFQLLGEVLAVAGGAPYAELVRQRVLAPVGCVDARCGEATDGERIVGYAGATLTSHWTQPLPGAGGIEMHVGDLGRWLEANTWPDRTPLADAVRLAEEPHWGDRTDGRGLGWLHYNGGLLHDGGTGGFRSMCCFVPEAAGVGVLANSSGFDGLAGPAIGFLTKVVRTG